MARHSGIWYLSRQTAGLVELWWWLTIWLVFIWWSKRWWLLKISLGLFPGKRAEDVHSPLCKGPWGKYGVELFCLLMDEVAMLLAWYAFFDKGVAIRLHSWPKLASFEYSGGNGSHAKVISAYAFMQFSNYILSFLGCDAFEEWLTISTLV